MVAAHPTTLRLAGEEGNSKRRQILDGARKVFMNLGFDGASMNEIARAAGVSKGTLYVYFADKNRLLLEGHRRGRDDRTRARVAFNFDPEPRRTHDASRIRPGLYPVAVPASTADRRRAR